VSFVKHAAILEVGACIAERPLVEGNDADSLVLSNRFDRNFTEDFEDRSNVGNERVATNQRANRDNRTARTR